MELNVFSYKYSTAKFQWNPTKENQSVIQSAIFQTLPYIILCMK